jgi:multisubunit Na+/H+ antiporter MnhE subunit
MSRFFSFLAGVLAFLVWIRLVGNPHVVETVIGLLLAIGVGWWVHRTLRRIFGGPR